MKKIFILTLLLGTFAFGYNELVHAKPQQSSSKPPFEIVGNHLGNDLYSFALDPYANHVIYIQLTTWGLCVLPQKAHGYVTSFDGVTGYTVNSNPEAPSNYLSVGYSYCTQMWNGTTCLAACCNSVNESLTGYLYRVSRNGSPTFIISETELTPGDCGVE